MPARAKDSKKKGATRKKAAAKKSASGKAPKKKTSGAQSARAKPSEPKPSTAKNTGCASSPENRRPFSLTAKQAATLQEKFSGCPVAWGLEVRTGHEFADAGGKGLPKNADWLFKSKDGLVGAEGNEAVIEGFELGVTFDKRITELPPLGALSSLGVSRLSAAAPLTSEKKSLVTDISSIGTLKGLKSLDLSNNTRLEDISPLGKLKKLETLKLSASAKLQTCVDLAGLTSLTSLDLSGCLKLSDLRGLPSLKNLRELILSKCIEITGISELARLANLKSLDLSGCQDLAGISELSGLGGLHRLNLSILPGRRSKLADLTDISTVAELNELRELDLGYFRSLENLSDLAGLKNLRTLNLTGCGALADISALSRLAKLEKLTLTGCTALVDISALSRLTKLQTLTLSGCTALADISALSDLQKLQTLDLTDCSKLDDVSKLTGLTKLRHLRLKGCGNRLDLERLVGCESLRELTWNEGPACHDVLAACASSRQDADLVENEYEKWIGSFRISKKPDRIAGRLVECFGLGGKADWAAAALESLIGPAREEHKGGIRAETWARWAEKVLALDDPDLRGPIEKALKEIDPEREITPLMDPVLTALANALPHLDADARAWACQQVEEVLAPHAGKTEQERKAAPAAVVFYMALDPSDNDGHVKHWLARGTVQKESIWRDKVQLAVIEWQLGRGDVEDGPKLEGALRELRRIQTRKYQDLAHKALAQHFDVFETPTDALVGHLEAIKDDGMKASLARQLAEDPLVTSEPGNFSVLLLALQDDRQALAALMERLLRDQHDVADAIRRAFDKEPREQIASQLADLDVESLDGDAALAHLAELKALVEGTKA